jgi:hypothetical protein
MSSTSEKADDAASASELLCQGVVGRGAGEYASDLRDCGDVEGSAEGPVPPRLTRRRQTQRYSIGLPRHLTLLLGNAARVSRRSVVELEGVDEDVAGHLDSTRSIPSTFTHATAVGVRLVTVHDCRDRIRRDGVKEQVDAERLAHVLEVVTGRSFARHAFGQR